MAIHNPFRHRVKRAHFNAIVAAYQKKHRDIIRPDGRRHDGNSIATYFWRGYDSSIPESRWDRASKEMMAYVTYRAGQEVAKEERANEREAS